MNYDHASFVGQQALDQTIRIRDDENLPEGPAWDYFVKEHPAVLAAVLKAQKKEKTNAAFRKKWRATPQPILPTPSLWKVIDRPEIPVKLLPPHSFLIQFKLTPPHSFLIQFKLTLAQRLMTSEDATFQVSDNALRSDHAFRRPFLAASSWKGSFGAALYQCSHARDTQEVIRLMGNDREEDKDFHQGRLRFFPSFFSKRAFYLLNPQNRKKGSGTIPVELETVPKGDQAWFCALYVPSASDTGTQIANDIELTAQGIVAMLRDYGFGAKVSSGFGSAQDAVSEGWIDCNSQSPRQPFKRLQDLGAAAAQIAARLREIK